MKRPLILVTNDDGISASGIRNLIRIMNDFGDVVVVAPDGPQSAMGHAITIDSTLRCDKIVFDKGPQKEYACSGTPVDCVKLAVNQLLERKPDLCVSGINHGSNSSINVIYSGTMSAAVEGALEGIPSIGFSLLDYAHDADFSESEIYIRKVTQSVLDNGMDTGDPKGRTYYWLTGKFVNYDKGTDTDEWALANHYVSIVPVHFDLTAYSAISALNKILSDE
jgi:5'-nucleotidase